MQTTATDNGELINKNRQKIFSNIRIKYTINSSSMLKILAQAAFSKFHQGRQSTHNDLNIRLFSFYFENE
ncbi:hypothetical protein MXB_4754 [Myxobolus squamalis]|nr:hypothetical protein MXB_4754 [Myxobolus squamalis]